MSGSLSEKVKKELQVLFKGFGLNLIIQCNKVTVDYLVITLNLLDGTYKTISKTRKYTTVHSERIQSPSKHHQTNYNYNQNTTSKPLIKQTVFRHAAEDYEKALKKLGYNVKLQYKLTNQNTNKINSKKFFTV